jgi:hypothetical protein
MSIIHMAASKSKADSVPGATNIRDASFDQNEGNGVVRRINNWLYDTHVGLCLREYERNGYDDSDFFMVTWDPVKKQPETIMFATTRGWCYPCMGSSVDASPEIRAEYDAYLKAKEIEESERLAKINAADPQPGKRVVVIGGRKHKGKSGIIFWRGANQFRKYYANGYNRPESPENQVCGIKTDSGEKFFICITQIQVKGQVIKAEDAVFNKNFRQKLSQVAI